MIIKQGIIQKTTERGGELLNVDGVAQMSEASRGFYQGLVARPGYWRSKEKTA